MISKEDVKQYLDKMLGLEIEMETEYKQAAKKVNDRELKSAFAKLSKEETEHALLVKKLQDLLKNWE